MLNDLPAGGAPHTFMRADVVESRIESADPMRLAGHERVDRDRHDAGDRLALAVQRVELTPQHRLEFGNRNLHFEIGRDVVGLDRIGQRHQSRAADVEQIRLIVVDPVADVADPRFGEVIERVPGLGQAGAEPADRALARRSLDAVDRCPDSVALLLRIHFGQPQRVGLVMADQLPAEPQGLLDDLRVMIADLAVERGAGADAVSRQDFHDPPDADSIAIVAHRPVAHVRDLGVLARHTLVLISRHHVIEAEELDIGIDP